MYSFSDTNIDPCDLQQIKTFNPLHPNISIDILHIVIYTFPKELMRRICLTIKSFFSW